MKEVWIITTGADYEVGSIEEWGFLTKEDAIIEAERLAEIHNTKQKEWHDKHNTPEDERRFYMKKRKELQWYSNGTYIEIEKVKIK